MNSPAALYRFFSAESELLYVGRSSNPFARFSSHACDKDWIREVARMEPQWLDSHADAVKAEAEAIAREKPRYNIRSEAKSLNSRIVEGDGPELLCAAQRDFPGNMHAFCRAINLNPVHLGCLRSGRKAPDAGLAFLIETVTRGAVPASSWAIQAGAEPAFVSQMDLARSGRLRAAYAAKRERERTTP